jgi:hypothetical protein
MAKRKMSGATMKAGAKSIGACKRNQDVEFL